MEVAKTFQVSLQYLSGAQVEALAELSVEAVPDFLQGLNSSGACPGFLADLARVELAAGQFARQQIDIQPVCRYQVNPTLELIEVDWSSLLLLIGGEQAEPFKEKQHLLFWRNPVTGQPQQAQATANDLLALKIVVEDLDPGMVAEQGGCPVGTIDRLLELAACKGLLLTPASKLTREPLDFGIPSGIPGKFLQAEAFTLQWHITQRCDLHCRHCYDRSRREDVGLPQGIDVLGQMRNFCRENSVYGQVSFSGGNPFMHPDFFALYRVADEHNLSLAILGNPVSETELDRLLRIAKPVFFQVSLEGLQEHNDQIRGAGNFVAVLDFLQLLKKKNIYSMVMLTLTQANLNQVLPLAELLRGRVDLFTYNRLSMVGEGRGLESPRTGDYQVFVAEYLQAQKHNPAMALKDSLINIEREKQQLGLFGGCTGFGCGAAFNFVSLLADGQVHACRKFPSLIGDLKKQSLRDVYYSEPASVYRRGCRECSGCHLRPVCGGCLAVAHGYGLDPLQKKDPGCFL